MGPDYSAPDLGANGISFNVSNTSKMPNKKNDPAPGTMKWIDQMCFRAQLAPGYTVILRQQRKGCTPKRHRSALPADDQRIIADVSVLPFHLNAYVISMAEPLDGAEVQCVLEIVRHVFMQFGATSSCVSLYRDGPHKLRHIAHIRFHDVPQGPRGIEENVQLILEIALLRLRGRHVRPLLNELRKACH